MHIDERRPPSIGKQATNRLRSMDKTQTALLLLVTIAFSLPAALHAQEDMPLDFGDKLKRLGFEVGFTSAWQSGAYRAGCGLFEEGANVNLLIAAVYDQQISDAFQFEGLIGYQSKNLSSTYLSEENIGISTEGGPVNAGVTFDNIGTANFSYVFFQPALKFYPSRNVYLGAGTSVNLLLGSATQYRKDIVSQTVQLNELGLSEVFYSETESSDPYSKVFGEESRDDASATTFDGIIMIGAEFRIGERYGNPVGPHPRKKITIGPRVQYAIPFIAALTEEQNELKLNGLHFLVGMRFELN